MYSDDKNKKIEYNNKLELRIFILQKQKMKVLEIHKNNI